MAVSTFEPALLVTGHGESRVLKEAGVVKQRVLELASELGTAVEPSNRECVVLECSTGRYRLGAIGQRSRWDESEHGRVCVWRK